MKRIFAFMLVLCMVFALAACGSAKSPAGSWTAKVNLADIAGDSMGEMADYLKDMMVDVNLDMNEDKTFVLKMDANSAIPALKEGMRAYMNDMLTGMGMTAEDYEAAAGASLDDLIDEAIAEMDPEDLSQTLKGTYTLEGSKLTLTAEDSPEPRKAPGIFASARGRSRPVPQLRKGDSRKEKTDSSASLRLRSE